MCESQDLSTLIEHWQRGQKFLEKANQSLNLGPPGLTPHTLITQPLPPLLLAVLYFWFINEFIIKLY